MKIAPEIKEKAALIVGRQPKTLAGHLGIEFLELDAGQVVASMPVNEHTKQPFGLLHGGASVALAETLASVGAWLNVDEKKFAVVGIEINANHLRAMKQGKVIGTGKPLHRGSSTHVWEINITADDGGLVCISRCTLAVVPLEKLQGHR